MPKNSPRWSAWSTLGGKQKEKMRDRNWQNIYKCHFFGVQILHIRLDSKIAFLISAFELNAIKHNTNVS